VAGGGGHWTGTRMLKINFRLPNLFIIQERQVRSADLTCINEYKNLHTVKLELSNLLKADNLSFSLQKFARHMEQK
jgi:hypothetical protein